MKNFQNQHHRVRNTLLIGSLAFTCIAGAEVAASRYFNPELYERICAPAYALRDAGVELGTELSEEVSEQIQSFQEYQASQRKARELEAQKRAEEEAAAEAAKAAAEAAKAAAEAEAEAEDQYATDPMLTENIVYADPSDTELVSVDGQEILTGGIIEITYFNQSDPTWADQPYGRDQIGPYGCGPTALAMVIASIGEEADPVSIAQDAVDLGCWASRSGSYSTIVSSVAESYGLTVESVSERTPDALCDAILSGKVLVALMGPGHFTQRGHYILIRGVTLSGELLVADPNSRERSLMVWDPQIILDELSKNTSNGGPLWAISLPNE
jgi:hypothetical protein